MSTEYWKKHYDEAGAEPGLSLLQQVGKTVHGQEVPAEQIDRIVEGIVRNLDLRAGHAMLDLCCGNGLLTARLAQRVATITGVDYSASLIDVARARNQPPNVTYLCHDVIGLAQETLRPGRQGPDIRGAAAPFRGRSAQPRSEVVRDPPGHPHPAGQHPRPGAARHLLRHAGKDGLPSSSRTREQASHGPLVDAAGTGRHRRGGRTRGAFPRSGTAAYTRRTIASTCCWKPPECIKSRSSARPVREPRGWRTSSTATRTWRCVSSRCFPMATRAPWTRMPRRTASTSFFTEILHSSDPFALMQAPMQKNYPRFAKSGAGHPPCV